MERLRKEAEENLSQGWWTSSNQCEQNWHYHLIELQIESRALPLWSACLINTFNHSQKMSITRIKVRPVKSFSFYNLHLHQRDAVVLLFWAQRLSARQAVPYKNLSSAICDVRESVIWSDSRKEVSFFKFDKLFFWCVVDPSGEESGIYTA